MTDLQGRVAHDVLGALDHGEVGEAELIRRLDQAHAAAPHLQQHVADPHRRRVLAAGHLRDSAGGEPAGRRSLKAFRRDGETF